MKETIRKQSKNHQELYTKLMRLRRKSNKSARIKIKGFSFWRNG